jgi:hypothetical protein
MATDSRRAADHSAANHFTEISDLARLVRDGYPKVAEEYRRHRQSLRDVRDWLNRTADDPTASVEFHPEMVEERKLLHDCEKYCREWNERLAVVSKLIIVHMTSFANSHRVIELLPQRWHEKPEAEWAPLLAALQEAENEAIASGDPAAQVKPATVMPRGKATPRGSAPIKILAALNLHHGFDGQCCSKFEPIGVRELAKLAGFGEAAGSVSRFFNKHFGGPTKTDGHDKYCVNCFDPALLAVAMRILNGDTTLAMLALDEHKH